MAKYKDIGGTTVGFRSGSEEYTYPSGFEGSIYYNSSNGQFEFVGIGAGTWATGGNMNTGRFNTASGFGTLTAGVACGGQTPADDYTDNVEEYNGTSWTEVTNTSRDKFNTSNSTGTQTAGILCGGYIEPENPASGTNATEEYDGTNWTSGGNYPALVVIGTLVGVQTAALYTGGTTPSGLVGLSNTYNGSSWTEITEINTARRQGTIGGGTTTDAVIGSGLDASNNTITNTETWNGSSWTEVSEMNTGRYAGSSSQNGVSTSVIAAGGRNPPNDSRTITELWNGTSWTETNDLSQKRYQGQGAGTGTAALAMGGNSGPGGNPAILVATEEWTFSHPIKTVTTS